MYIQNCTCISVSTKLWQVNYKTRWDAGGTGGGTANLNELQETQ